MSNDPARPKGIDQRPVRPIGSLINQLMSRRGYAQVSVNEMLNRTIARVLDPHLHATFLVGNLRGGVLQIFAKDSVSLQELSFRKRAILQELQKSMPECQVRELRFRIQV
jgi:hypothetical protein